MDVVPGELHVVRNIFFGEPEKFELFNNSKTKIEAEKRGTTIDCPDLADRVTDDLYSNRFSVARASEEMPIGNRAELKRWRSRGWKMFDEIGIAEDAQEKENNNSTKDDQP